MKLLTFLGIADYKETTYVLGELSHTTRYCPAAMAHFFRPGEALVVVTKAARQKHYDALVAGLPPGTMPRPVDIPDGHSEPELWQMFEALTRHIAVGQELVVDITNGFRSLPFLSFLAVAYLRRAKDAQVQGIYYGAYEARDEANRSPVFNLTPFLTLLDWTTATDQFLATGDAGQLTDLLRQAQRLAYLGGQQARTDLPRRLQNVAGAIDALARGLRLARPEEVMTAAAGLAERLEAVRPEAEVWARPFALLLDRTRQDYADFALEGEPRAAQNLEGNLAIQRRLVRWYVERRQYVQAIMLAREWLVSYTAYCLGWDVISDRTLVEEVLFKGAEAHRERRALPVMLRSVPDADALVRLWNSLPDLRNDIAHVGMRAQPRPVDSIIKTAESIPGQLDDLTAGVAGG